MSVLGCQVVNRSADDITSSWVMMSFSKAKTFERICSMEVSVFFSNSASSRASVDRLPGARVGVQWTLGIPAPRVGVQCTLGAPGPRVGVQCALGNSGGVQWTLGTPLGFELANSRLRVG